MTKLKAKTHFFKDCNLSQVLNNNNDGQFTGTKIMCTLGPSCHEVSVLSSMLDAGLAACRVDLTWGPIEFHRKSFQNLMDAMKQTRKLCATVIDTMGRELMIRGQYQVNDQGYPWVLGRNEVKAGQTITITTRTDVEATSDVLPIMYDKFTQMTQKGDTIYIGRYLVSGADSASLYLQVVEVIGTTEVVCLAMNDAVLEGLLCVFHAERSHDTLLNVQNELPLLSQWDEDCIRILGQEFEIDHISLSYTRNGEDVRECRRFLDSLGMTQTKIIAKVETRQALFDFQSILAEADAVMISRGNLGLDCEPEKMALVQKTLIQACNLVGKPAFITRVVDTMAHTPRPTRAEATDVANAVLDGVDGILLGAETLRGKYPLDTVKTVASICRAAEAVFDHNMHYEVLIDAAVDMVSAEDPSHYGDGYGSGGNSLHGGHALAAVAAAASSGHVHGTSGGTVHGPSRSSGAPSTGQDSTFQALKAMAQFSMVASHPNIAALDGSQGRGEGTVAAKLYSRQPYLSKLESIASSAVRVADKVGASLIVVYTHTGKTAELVAKYRPPIPILTLVVPKLVSEGLRWKLEGRSVARQCLITRGLLPVLAAPSPSGEALLEDAVSFSVEQGLVRPHDHVVCVQRVNDDFCVKVVSVDELGLGIKKDAVAFRGRMRVNSLGRSSTLGPAE